MSGFIFKIGGGSVSWRSKKRRLHAEILGELKAPAEIFRDNQAAMKLAWNYVLNERKKHIEVKYYFAKDKVMHNNVLFNYVRTDENAADYFPRA